MVDATDGNSLRLKLDRVTQACIARGFSAQTWLRLIREALQQEVAVETSQEKLVTACIDSLFSTNGGSGAGLPHDILIRSYILVCCTLQPPSSDQNQAKLRDNPRQLVVDVCLTNGVKAMIAATTVPNDMDVSSSSMRNAGAVMTPAPTTTNLLDAVAEVILSTAIDATTNLPSPAISLPASFAPPEKAHTPLTSCLRLLHGGIQQQHMALCLLTLQLLQNAIATQRTTHVKISTRTTDVEALDEVLRALQNLALEQQAALPGSTPSSFMTSEQIHGSLTVLNRLRSALDPVSARHHRICGTKRKLAEMSAGSDQRDLDSAAVVSEDIVVCMWDAVQNCRVASTLKSQLRAAFVARLLVAVNARSIHDSGAAHLAAIAAFVPSVLDAVQNLVSIQHLQLSTEGGPTTQPTDRHKALWASIIYGALPAAVASAIRQEWQKSSAIVDIDWQGLLPTKDVNNATRGMIPVMQRVIEGLRDSLDQADIQPEPSSAIPETPDLLFSLLAEGLLDYKRHSALATSTAETIAKWCEASDILSLNTFLRLVSQETPRMLDYVFLHIEPSVLLRPVCRILDEWSEHDESGAGQAMELYGSMLTHTMSIVHRHCLHKHVATMSTGFLLGYFTSASAACVAHSIDALETAEQALVSSWTSALFGNDGIEDDLIRKTDPRKMVRLSIVILDQSLMALAQGCIDADTLQGGLSYFTQDLLNFCIPGMIAYLYFANKDNAVSHTDVKTILSVIKTLLLASTTPKPVIHLVGDRTKSILTRPAFAQYASDAAAVSARFTKQPVGSMQLVMPADIASLGNVPQQVGPLQTAAMLLTLRQAYTRASPSRTIDSPVSVYLQSSSASRSDGAQNVLLTTAFLLTYPLQNEQPRSTLARAFLSEYLPAFFRGIAPVMLDDAAISARLDSLADLTAVLQARASSLDIQLPQKRGNDPVSKDFWRRVESWTSLSGAS